MLLNLAYETLRQFLTIPIIIATTALLAIYTTLRIFFAGSKPSETVWAPSNARGPLAALHSAVHSTLDIRKTLRAGSQRGGAFLVSTFLDGATVGLPVESMGWMAALPETTASMHAVQYRRLHLQYTLEPAEERDPRLVRMLMRLLGRFEESVVPILHEEIRAGFEAISGDGGGEGGWRTVCIHDEMLGVVARATNRYLVGKPLCRDDEYLGLLSSYTTSAVPIAMFLHLVPDLLLPVVGGLIRRARNRLYQRKLLRKLVPLVRKQIESTQRKAESGSPTFLTRCIDEQTRQKDLLTDARVDPAPIAQVMIQLNFAGVHTVAAMATQTLYHILSYPQADDLMSDLRRENAAILKGADGDGAEKEPSSKRNLTSSDLSKMPLLNSVVREALRISPMIATAMDLLVLKDISTPSGVHLAAGTKIFIPGDAANQNPQVYADPATFNPYRFVEKNELAADPSKVFVSFGYGVHVSASLSPFEPTLL